MARTTYTDADKASAFVVLTANDGIVKRTARETGIPETTIRSWKVDWEKNGPPPVEEVEIALGGFLDDATKARGMAVEVILLKLEHAKQNLSTVKLAELSTVVGVLDDKITRAAGLGSGQRVDHFHHLPAPDELRALMQEYVEGSISLAEQRAEEIVDAEFAEQPALPSGQ